MATPKRKPKAGTKPDRIREHWAYYDALWRLLKKGPKREWSALDAQRLFSGAIGSTNRIDFLAWANDRLGIKSGYGICYALRDALVGDPVREHRLCARCGVDLVAS